MKPTLLLYATFAAAVAAAALPLAAVAQEATPEPAAAVSASSRADVTAELWRARRAGDLKVLRAGYIGEVPAPRSRDDVRAELQRARASGEWQALQAEAIDFARSQPGEAPRALAQRR